MENSFVRQVLEAFHYDRASRRRTRRTVERSVPVCVQPLESRQFLSGNALAIPLHAISPDVASAPMVTTNPTDQLVKVGTTATFTAAASGSPTPTVQWQFSSNGGTTFSNMSGKTSPTLTFTVTAAENNFLLRAVFTNASGTATTTAAKLTAATVPLVTTNPTNQVIKIGQTATFTVAATGTPTPTVQWQYSSNGGTTFANLGGKTAPTLSFVVAASENNFLYRAVFTNAVGSATTTAAKLTAATTPVVSKNPVSQTVKVGQTATFTAAATGTPVPTVQWQVSSNGGTTYSNLSGQTTTTLSFVITAAQTSYKYRAVFTNAAGTATTTAATLTAATVPVVSTNPLSQAIKVGQTATFTAAATGVPSPTVQWQVSTNGGTTFTNLVGQTTTSLSFIVGSTQNGYQYRAVFTNLAGSATTAAATLTATTVPVVTTNPTSQALGVGATAVFTAAATGTPNPTVQWQVSTNGGTTFTNINGQTTTTLNVTVAVGINGYQYRAVFTNSAGSANTTAATLNVATVPAVTTNPTSQSVVNGHVATFTAAASGLPAPTVQWQVSSNGGTTFTNIVGATSLTLTFTVCKTQDGYKYRAVFTNSSGSATSTAATLTVTPAPVVATLIHDFGNGEVTQLATINGFGLVNVSFGSDSQLWATNGTTATMVHDFGNVNGGVSAIGTVNGNLFIGVGVDGSQPQNVQIWRTDGTVAHTVSVNSFSNAYLSITPMVNGIAMFAVYDTVSHNGTLYGVNTNGTLLTAPEIGGLGNLGSAGFLGAPPITGLGTVNGTSTGTALISVSIYNGGIFPIKVQLWGTDGTHGTTMLHDYGTGSSMLTNVGTVNNVGLIAAEIGADNQLWGTNGTLGGTGLLHDFGGGVIAGLATASDGVALLSISIYNLQTTTLTDTQLWGTIGSSGTGTYLVKDYGKVTLNLLGVVNGVVEFYANNQSTYDNQVWNSNGHTTSTTLVHDFTNSIVTALTTINGVVLFGVHTKTAVPTDTMWGISGTPGNLAVVHNFAGNSYLSYVGTVDGVALINQFAPLPSNGSDNQLWKTDGSALSTTLIHDFGAFSTAYVGFVNGFALIGIFDFSLDSGQLWGVSGL